MKNRIWTKHDMVNIRQVFLHEQGLKAYDSLAKRFDGNYELLRSMIANIALMYLDKTTKERELKAGDDLYAILKI